ncbi:hypothetical protein ADUPG1_009037 [Aduncisulcus paluster]|uniref:Telomere length regulation protein TEL2 homolog n=1 Tax=Aduncisulcus paluster TaxID=2918883 RepID=A0ABQ5KU38_9EUKA|nr:hypothetical protein ADUPG1_009037 [Aduncisulcus paluster]
MDDKSTFSDHDNDEKIEDSSTDAQKKELTISQSLSLHHTEIFKEKPFPKSSGKRRKKKSVYSSRRKGRTADIISSPLSSPRHTEKLGSDFSIRNFVGNDISRADRIICDIDTLLEMTPETIDTSSLFEIIESIFQCNSSVRCILAERESFFTFVQASFHDPLVHSLLLHIICQGTFDNTKHGSFRLTLKILPLWLSVACSVCSSMVSTPGFKAYLEEGEKVDKTFGRLEKSDSLIYGIFKLSFPAFPTSFRTIFDLLPFSLLSSLDICLQSLFNLFTVKADIRTKIFSVLVSSMPIIEKCLKPMIHHNTVRGGMKIRLWSVLSSCIDGLCRFPTPFPPSFIALIFSYFVRYNWPFSSYSDLLSHTSCSSSVHSRQFSSCEALLESVCTCVVTIMETQSTPRLRSILSVVWKKMKVLESIENVLKEGEKTLDSVNEGETSDSTVRRNPGLSIPIEREEGTDSKRPEDSSEPVSSCTFSFRAFLCCVDVLCVYMYLCGIDIPTCSKVVPILSKVILLVVSEEDKDERSALLGAEKRDDQTPVSVTSSASSLGIKRHSPTRVLDRDSSDVLYGERKEVEKDSTECKDSALILNDKRCQKDLSVLASMEYLSMVSLSSLFFFSVCVSLEPQHFLPLCATLLKMDHISMITRLATSCVALERIVTKEGETDIPAHGGRAMLKVTATRLISMLRMIKDSVSGSKISEGKK